MGSIHCFIHFKIDRTAILGVGSYYGSGVPKITHQGPSNRAIGLL
jgi:hypothetical protein